MRLSTLVVDQGQSKLGVHRDPPGPLYAMIAGPGNYAWNGSEWQQVMQGARLILVDGWFDISYGPRDLVFLDGNYMHGISSLCDLPRQKPTQLERFSMIFFCPFARVGMPAACNEYHNEWREEMLSSVLWRPGMKPPSPMRERRRETVRLITIV